MTRKQFVTLGLRGVGAAATVMLVGCPDDDDDVVDEEVETTVGTETTVATEPTETTTGPETTAATEPTETTAVDDTVADDTVNDETETETGEVPVCEEVDTLVGPPDVGPEHDHTVAIPAADVVAGRTTTYMLSMDLGHVHEITVTDAMFALLRQGEQVEVDTLLDATAHAHTVTLVCQ